MTKYTGTHPAVLWECVCVETFATFYSAVTDRCWRGGADRIHVWTLNGTNVVQENNPFHFQLYHFPWNWSYISYFCGVLACLRAPNPLVSGPFEVSQNPIHRPGTFLHAEQTNCCWWFNKCAFCLCFLQGERQDLDAAEERNAQVQLEKAKVCLHWSSSSVFFLGRT